MTRNQELKSVNRRALRAIAPFGPAVFVVALLGGCSYIPDAANPLKWYDSTVEFFAGEEEAPKDEKQSALAKDRGKTPAATKTGFPKLSDVERQKQFDDKRGGGLVADVEGRKYAPAIARQGEPASVLAEAPAKPQSGAGAPAQPAPPAIPMAQVVSVAPATGAPPSTAAVSPEVAALSSTLDQTAFQVRMRDRLAEIRARAGQSANLTSASMARPSTTAANASMNANPIETVVISSAGIEPPVGGAMTAPISPVMSASLAPGAVRVATINFGNGSARLSASDRRIIAQVRRLQKERGGRLRIVGHASSRTRTMDPVSHKMTNLQVSTKRAGAVARELARLGVATEEMVVDAVSDRQPVYYEFMPTGEAGNRRAEIYLEG